VYFTRTAGAGGQFGVILVSSLRVNARWTVPHVADFSGRYADYDPFVAPDGSRLFFISKRPVSGSDPRSDFDMWMVEKEGAGWGTARHLGATVNSDGDELYPAVASDGTLYFSSCGRADSRGRCDLYRSRLRDGHYQAPENLGDAVNTPASETDAYVAPDQSYLIFTGYGRTGAGNDGDLYLSTRQGDGWSEPRVLASGINTLAREYCPIVSPDGKYLYFTSQRGFPDLPRGRGLTYPEFRDSLRSVGNGLGNIYRIPLAALGLPPSR
jgi:hypothetical protein